MEITGERILAEEEQEILIVGSDAQRFRSPEPTASAAGAPGGASGIAFDYQLPEGWSEAPKSGMRQLNFTFGENGEGECYLTMLQGSAGGLEANVNRWRGQMGLEPVGPDEIAALPKKKLFGLEATFISLDGDFLSGFGSPEPQKDYRLLGVIVWIEQIGSIFVKLTGPRDVVEANAEDFDALCASIRPR